MPVTLLGLDVGRPDHLCPFLGFVGDELAEVGGRTRKHSGSQVSKPLLQFGIGQDGIDLPAELVDDLGWCLRGHADAVPSACLKARQKFVDSRDVRKCCRARRSRHR